MAWQQLKHVRVEQWMLAIVGLAFAVRLYQLDGQSLWFDEIFTVAMARLSWHNGMVGVLGHGIQLTPLFHWAIKLWLPVGDSDWLVRLPSLVFGVLTIPMIFKLGRFYFNDQAGLVGAFIFAINPYQVWYGQELRLYTLLAFAAAGAMLSFGQMLGSKGQAGTWKLFFYHLIGFPTHYFMFLIPTVQFLYLMATFKRNYLLLRRWVIVQIVAVLPIVLWWLFILQQHRSNIGIGWVPQPQWLTPLFSLWNFSFGYSGSLSVLTVFFMGVMLIGLGLGVWRAWRAPGLGRLLILWLVFPPLIIISLSFGRVSFYVDRYLIIITPVLTILTVSGLLSLRFELLRWGLLSIFMAATLLGLFYLYFDRAHFAKDDWRALARLLDAQAREGEAVIACTDGFRLAFEYYNPHQVIEAGDVLDASQLGDGAALSGYQTAWIVVTHPLPSVHALANNEPPLWDKNELSAEAAEWETHNFLGDVRVPGISAYHYRVVNSSVLTEVIDWRC